MKTTGKSSGIGGQAVLEGIMMKHEDVYSIGVRRPDGEIEVHLSTYEGVAGKKIKKIPIIRGVVNFVDSLILGMKCLTFSASFYDEEDDSKPSAADVVVQKLFGDQAEKVVMGMTVAFSIVMAVAIFMIFPYFLANFLRQYIVSDSILAVIEGAIRLLLFIAYVLLISLMKDIQRVFQYHGAEHKCINCIEAGLELDVENVRISSKRHKRCGTSFMLIVMVISIIFFIFIRVDSPILRVLFRVALVPVIAGVSYEFIRLAGNTDNAVMGILSKPGMWLQALTTKEPDDDMIEVAIAAVDAVFDWREYQGRPSAEEAVWEIGELTEKEDLQQTEEVPEQESVQAEEEPEPEEFVPETVEESPEEFVYESGEEPERAGEELEQAEEEPEQAEEELEQAEEEPEQAEEPEEKPEGVFQESGEEDELPDIEDILEAEE